MLLWIRVCSERCNRIGRDGVRICDAVADAVFEYEIEGVEEAYIA